MDYNKTINLPKTDFPMRAGLPKREPDMLKHWEEIDLYNELLKKNEGKPLFNPCTTARPFQRRAAYGHRLMNKALKDIINRCTPCAATTPPIFPAGITMVCPSSPPSSSRTS